MIFNEIQKKIKEGDIIPKPEAKEDFRVIRIKGKRRGLPALVYRVPNSKSDKKIEKGVNQDEFEAAYLQLKEVGSFTRDWFNSNLVKARIEGSCNFTTIGGIFELLEIAYYAERGCYRLIQHK
jgi:hypothetical protein